MLRGITDVPVIIATARDDETEIVRLLNAGADDYLTKPFSVEHLSARMAAVLRRSRAAGGDGPPETVLRVGGLSVDPLRRQAELDGVRLDLTRREFDLLAFLAARPGVVVPRKELLAEVWQQSYGDDQTIDVHLSWLRRKLGETAAQPRYLHTLRGVGVKLEPPGGGCRCEMGSGQGLPGGHHHGRGRLRHPARPRRQGDGPGPRVLQRRAAGRRRRPGAVHHHRPRPAGAGRRLRGLGLRDGRSHTGRQRPEERSEGRRHRTAAGRRRRHRDRAETGPRLHHRGARRLHPAPAGRAQLRRDSRRRGVRPRVRGEQRRRDRLGGARGRRHRARRRLGRGRRPARRPDGAARPETRRGRP